MSLSTQELSPAESGHRLEISSQESDASCRWPVLVFFGSAAFWFLFSGLLGLLVSVKLHSSDFLASCPWLTYGRIRPAQLDAFMYGFAAQAAFGVTLWLFCRLGRARLIAPLFLIFAAKIWNIGVLVGVIGIMAGDGTGFDWLNFPAYASPILFIAHLLVGVWAVLTFHSRQQEKLFPSQWYLLAALFWFAWIYSAANLLLVFSPVRGVVQLCVSAWYGSNLLNVWMSAVGLGAIFYFIPKLTGRPLYSYYLALFAFWTLALFGGWGSINVNAPLPSWIPALSAVAAMMMALPILAVALNVWNTLWDVPKSAKANPVLGFITFGAFSFVLAQSMNVVSSLRSANEALYFTHFTTAQTSWLLLGFFASVMFGAIYYIVPRLLGAEPFTDSSVRMNRLVLIGGVLVYSIALALGGIVQGKNLNDPAVAFPDVIKSTLPFLYTSTIGTLLVLLAGILLALNLFSFLYRFCRNCCQAKSREVRS